MSRYSARDKIHARYCRDDQCLLEYNDPGKSCLALDFMLTLVEIEGLEDMSEDDRERSRPLNTLYQVHRFAEKAHAGQTDKLGVPYFQHVKSVALGLADFGQDLMMAGYLHDVLEDTTWTAADLERLGVPPRVLTAVQAVTNTPGEPYQAKILKVAMSGRDATLIKISDNAHNSRPDRLAHLDDKTRQRLEKKYAQARSVLWAAVPAADVRRIVEIVNPALLGD